MTKPCLDDLVRGLYAGIRSERPFKAFLIDLAEQVDADAATIVIERKTLDHPGAVFSGHAPDSRRSAYDMVFDADPFHGLPLNRAITIHEHLGPELFSDLPFMAQFMQGIGLQNVLGLDVEEPGGTRIRLRASRRVGQCDFGSGEKGVFDLLARHLSEATGLFLRLDTAQVGARLYASALNRLAIGAAVLDRHGHILSITEQAQQILHRRGLLARSDSGLRLAVGHARRIELAEAVRKLATADPVSTAPDPPWPIQIHGDEGEVLNLILRRAEPCTRLDRPLEGSVVMTVCDVSSTVAPSGTTLARLFGLTPAEAELTALLGQGLDLDSASAVLKISKNTAKAHLRMIFSKTRVTRQSSLVRLVLRSVDELLPCDANDPNRR